MPLAAEGWARPRRQPRPDPLPDGRPLAERVCTRKAPYGQRAAMGLATSISADLGEAITAYRCPIDSSHWHIGHSPTMHTLRELAAYLRGLDDSDEEEEE